MKRKDRLFLSLLTKLSTRAINHLTIVKPSTLLDYQRRFIKNYWTYNHKTPGRKPVSKEIKDLVLEMKIDNLLWGCHRISDELKKIGIDLHPTAVNKIIQTLRKQGKIQPNGNWKKFLKSNWNSLYGMDFMTIDTLLGKRFYLLIILELHSRKIIQYDLTKNLGREFVKQRIELFSEDLKNKKTLPLANSTKNDITVVINQIMKEAVRDEEIKVNPIRNVESLSKEPEKPGDVLSFEEVKRLFPLEYSEALTIWETHRNYTLMLLLVTSGMRSGELI